MELEFADHLDGCIREFERLFVGLKWQVFFSSISTLDGAVEENLSGAKLIGLTLEPPRQI